MDSHQALYEFIVHHKIDMDSVGNCTFNAKVDYESPSNSVLTTTRVRFVRNGYDDGKVEIAENEELQPESYHLDVTAKWQDYRFDLSSGKLIVVGSSPKMGGSYVIQISPN